MSDALLKELQRQAETLMKAINNLGGEAPVISFREYALQYLSMKMDRPTLRASTKQAFSIQVMNHLIPTLGPYALDKITNAEWLRQVNRFQSAKPQRISRFFNMRKALMEILIAAKEEGHLQKVPKLDNPDEVRNVGRCLEDKEILQIIWHTKRPFRIIFYMLWKSGVRPREMLRYEWTMFRFKEPGHTWIDIPARISKTNRQRSIPINPEVSRILYLRFMRSNGSLFVFPHTDNKNKPQLSYNSAWKSACRKAKVKAVPYDLRRSFVTKCAAAGMPLLYVAKLLDSSTKMLEGTYAKQQVEVMENIIK